jgi:hypothetical protein
MKQYIDKNRVEEILRNLWKKDDGYNAEHRICYNKALQEVQCELDTLEVKEVEVETKINTLISDSRKANRAKFIKELKQKIDSYERELSKSGDSTKCDDVDWVTLASDMFDMLQKCLINF